MEKHPINGNKCLRQGSRKRFISYNIHDQQLISELLAEQSLKLAGIKSIGQEKVITKGWVLYEILEGKK